MRDKIKYDIKKKKTRLRIYRGVFKFGTLLILYCRLYWCDAYTDKIESVNALTGLDRYVSLIDIFVKMFEAIMIFGLITESA